MNFDRITEKPGASDLGSKISRRGADGGRRMVDRRVEEASFPAKRGTLLGDMLRYHHQKAMAMSAPERMSKLLRPLAVFFKRRTIEARILAPVIKANGRGNSGPDRVHARAPSKGESWRFARSQGAGQWPIGGDGNSPPHLGAGHARPVEGGREPSSKGRAWNRTTRHNCSLNNVTDAATTRSNVTSELGIPQSAARFSPADGTPAF
jgi:hypothetical protein